VISHLQGFYQAQGQPSFSNLLKNSRRFIGTFTDCILGWFASSPSGYGVLIIVYFFVRPSRSGFLFKTE